MLSQFHRLLGTGLLPLVSLVCVACASAPETDSTAVSPSPTATTAPATPGSSPATAPPAAVPPRTAQPLKSSSTTNAQSSEPSVQVENCVVTQAIAADPNPPLNIRSAPEVQSNNVLGTLNNGTWLSVVAEKDGWFQVKSMDREVTGWVAKNRTESNCNQKTARITFPTAGGTIAIGDRFVGTGSHKYILRANQGQTLTVTNQKDVFPIILTPTGQPLIPGTYDESRQDWTGELPATGEYTLELDSNFKGYDYAFSARLK